MSTLQATGGPEHHPLATGQSGHIQPIKKQLHQQLLDAINLGAMGTLKEADLRHEVRGAIEELCRLNPALLTGTERDHLVEEMMDEVFGLGPLEPLMQDPTISDILVNGPRQVFVERLGRLEETRTVFEDHDHLLRIIQRIVARVGRHVDEANPMVDARLSDGSRVNAAIPPLTLDGAALSIRRFGNKPLKVADLESKGAITPEMVQFLEACAKARVNLIVSGGTGSGKTTLLNALSAFIPSHERIITIEDAAELRLQQRHVVRMETRPASSEGTGEVKMRDLVKNALRMRPDRIIVGECRGAEALDMLQAMNTGHPGSMTTIHANDTRDAISRLEMMVGMAGFDLPIWILRRQIASAVQIIVQVARLSGGLRKVIKISEITSMEGDVVSMQDLFVHRQHGIDERGMARGEFYATGIRPNCLERLESAGFPVSPRLFEERALSS